MGPSRASNTFGQAAVAAEQPLAGVRVPRKVVLLVFAAIGLLYASWIHNQWHPTNDGARYLTLARSIAEGDGYRFNGQIDNVFPPGLPLLLAGVYRLIGENYLVFNALMVLFAFGAFAAIYASLRQLTDATTAILIAAMTALSYRFFNETGRLLTDVPTTMLFWLTIYLCLRFCRGRWPWLPLAALAAVATALFRTAGVLMLAALGVGLVLDRSLGGSWRRRLLAAAATAGPALMTTVLLYALARQASTAPPRYEAQLQDAIAGRGELLASVAGRLPAVLGNLMTAQQFWAYGALLIVLVLAGAAGSIARRRGLAPAVAVLYSAGLIAVVVLEFAVRVRMWFPIQPMLLLLAFEGIALLCVAGSGLRRVEHSATRRFAALMIAIFAFATVAINLPRIFGTASENAYHVATGRAEGLVRPNELALFPMARAAGALADADAQIMVRSQEDADRLHYLSRRITTTWPDEPTVEAVHQHACRNQAICCVLVPLKQGRPSSDLAGDVRKAFDDDPSWRVVLENEFYVLYHRASSPE